MKLLIPILLSLLTPQCGAELRILQPLMLPRYLHKWNTIGSFNVRNEGNKDVNVALYYNETWPTDEAAVPSPGGGWPFPRSRGGAFDDQLARGVQDALGQGNPEALPRLYLRLKDKQELSAEKIHWAQTCFASDNGDCHFTRRTGRSSACVPTVRIMKYIRVIRIDYAGVIQNCSAADLEDDVLFLKTHFAVDQVDIAQKEDKEEEPLPEEAARESQRRLLMSLDDAVEEHFGYLIPDTNDQPDAETYDDVDEEPDAETYADDDEELDDGAGPSSRVTGIDDPYTKDQWHIFANKGDLLTQGSGAEYRKVTVLVIICRGVWYEHPDMINNVWVNQAELNGKPGVDDDGNGYIDDIYGWTAGYTIGQKPLPRGREDTISAGLVGAHTANRVGVAGVARNGVKLAVCSWGTADTSDNIAECIDWALSINARITLHLHSEWSTSAKVPNMVTQAAYDALHDVEVLAVHTAGHNGRSVGPNNRQGYVYPACWNYPNFITVTGTNKNGARMSSSNIGENCVTLGAPGTDIFSTDDPNFKTRDLPSDITDGEADDDNSSLRQAKYYGKHTHTNHAAAYVAAVAGVMIKKVPVLRAFDVKARMRWAIIRRSSLARPNTLFGGELDLSKIRQSVKHVAAEEVCVLHNKPGGCHTHYPQRLQPGATGFFAYGFYTMGDIFPDIWAANGTVCAYDVDENMNILELKRAHFEYLENARYIFWREDEKECLFGKSE